MAKISELTAITAITDSDLIMITDAETSASKKVTWANAKASINTAITIEGESNNSARLTVSQANDGTDAPDIMFKKARGTIDSPTTVQASDVLSRFQAFAYDGSSYVQGGNFGFTAADGSGNATWQVKTRAGGTLATRINIDNNGAVNVDGDLIVNPSSSKSPTSNGELLFEATNDTTITVKFKGSDGVVRSGTISLS